MNTFDIKGKKAIVTGGTRGLGYGMAQGLLENGAEVVVIGSSDKAFSTAQEMEGKGFQCYGVKADLSNREQVACGFEEALKKLGGKVDILINSAGTTHRDSAEDFPLEEWDRVLAVNLSAAFQISQLAGAKMLEQGKGSIINVASMISFFGGQRIPAYAATKGGIAQLTKELSNDWSSRGIRVNAIAPGYMVTELNRALIEDKVRFQQISDRIPMGRWGTLEDMKGIAVFLASDASSYITGAVIPVDGGYLAK